MKNLIIIGGIGLGVFLLLRSNSTMAAVRDGQMVLTDTKGTRHIITKGMDGTLHDEAGRVWV